MRVLIVWGQKTFTPAQLKCAQRGRPGTEAKNATTAIREHLNCIEMRDGL